ncbi:MAG: PepSY-like domain-containing protein [Muribaculaceae bacterium]|nr:PepSY-like domain-containing protein [Muribaculaceae bacterium]
MMKLYSLAIIGLCSIFAACSSKDVTTTDASVLPTEAQNFISKNYQGVNITQVKIDKEALGDEYEVYLSNGTSLDFNSKGELEKAKAGRNDSIPNSIIPTEITQYIHDAYPGAYIVKYEIEKGIKEVELSNGLEINFDIQNNVTADK